MIQIDTSSDAKKKQFFSDRVFFWRKKQVFKKNCFLSFFFFLNMA